MKIIGVTGGIGAGKSTILSYLEQKYHAFIIRADEVAARLEEPGGACYQEIIDQFGPSVLQDDGFLDRKKMAGIVFGDPGKLERLNEIVHPAVFEEIRRMLDEFAAGEKDPSPDHPKIAAIEAALLLEAGYDKICDEVWYIYVSEEERIRRLMRDRGYSMEKCRQIMKSQLPEKVFREKCRVIIDNSEPGVENTYKQIDHAIREGDLT